MTSIASAGLTNTYAKVEKSADCGVSPGTQPTWFQTTTTFYDMGGNVYETSQNLPATDIDGIRIAVDCADCELDVYDFSWWSVGFEMWGIFCDLEGPSGTGWRMEQLNNICNTDFENMPACGEVDNWGKLKYSYESSETIHYRIWRPYEMAC